MRSLRNRPVLLGCGILVFPSDDSRTHALRNGAGRVGRQRVDQEQFVIKSATRVNAASEAACRIEGGNDEGDLLHDLQFRPTGSYAQN